MVSLPVLLADPIIGIVFVPKILQLSVFVLDPIGYELVSNRQVARTSGMPLKWRHDPHHPFLIIVNIVWLILFGWSFFLVHIFSAIVQLLPSSASETP